MSQLQKGETQSRELCLVRRFNYTAIQDRLQATGRKASATIIMDRAKQLDCHEPRPTDGVLKPYASAQDCHSCMACHTTCTISIARMRMRFLRAASPNVRTHCWQAEITTCAPVS